MNRTYIFFNVHETFIKTEHILGLQGKPLVSQSRNSTGHIV